MESSDDNTVDKQNKKVYLFDVSLDDLINVDCISLSEIEYAASLCALRTERFVDNFSVHTELIKLCNKFFGEKVELEETGLNAKYKEMREYVKEKNLIAIILCGLNRKDTLIQNYTTMYRQCIKLTISSITRSLLRYNFSKREIETLCKLTNNFNIYYKSHE